MVVEGITMVVQCSSHLRRNFLQARLTTAFLLKNARVHALLCTMKKRGPINTYIQSI